MIYPPVVLSACILCNGFCLSAFSQSPCPPPERFFEDQIHFVQYLTGKGDYDEAEIALASMDTTGFQPARMDSMNYHMGLIGYYNEQLERSVANFNRVGENGVYFLPSRFFAAYELIHLHRLEEALQMLENIDPAREEEKHRQLRILLSAGAWLLKGNFQLCDSLLGAVPAPHYALLDSWNNMKEYRAEMEKSKTPSPLMAGVLSVLLPGSGKLYAGKRGEGISAFFMVSVMGGVAVEQFLHGGFANPQFYLFSAAFAAFYFGNIYGSIFSVIRKRDEKNYERQRKILFDLHASLRSVLS